MAAVIAEACVRASCASVLHISSQSVFGEGRHLRQITECTPIRPTSWYGLSKAHAEDILQKACDGHMPLTIIRPPFVYGPGDNQLYTPSGFVRDAFVNKEILLWGDGREIRNFLFIGDLIQIILHAIDGAPGKILHVDGGNRASFRDVAFLVKELFPKPIVIRSRPRTGPRCDFAYRVTRMPKQIGISRYTSLEAGIEECVMSYSARPNRRRTES